MRLFSISLLLPISSAINVPVSVTSMERAHAMPSGRSAEFEVFDIFSGSSDRDAVWIEAVAGLDQAKQRMQQIAAKTQGAYFVFCAKTKSILDRTDTRARSNIEIKRAGN
jgi:hypothetical protein